MLGARLHLANTVEEERIFRMEQLHKAGQLAVGGRFGEALCALDSAPVSRSDRTAADVLRASLLEAVGRHGQCRTLLQQLLKSKELTFWHIVI